MPKESCAFTASEICSKSNGKLIPRTWLGEATLWSKQSQCLVRVLTGPSPFGNCVSPRDHPNTHGEEDFHVLTLCVINLVRRDRLARLG